MRAILVPLAVVAILASWPGAEAARSHRAKHGHGHHASTAVRRPQVPYQDPRTPTCRYADGTPFDPDIIGGPNHVGDGGPAANFGGSDPCGS